MKLIREPAVKMIGQRPPKNLLWPNREAFFIDLGIFVLGLAGIFSVGFIGSLPFNEVLIFPFLPALLLFKGRRAFNRQYLWFYVLVVAWLLGTLIADSYFSSPLQSRLKGAARVIFFALNFIGLSILINHRTRRIIIFVVSLAVVTGRIGMSFAGETSLMWKFGLSGSVAIIALLLSSYFYSRQRYRVCFFISLGLAALNLYYGFRSQLVVHLVSAVFVLPIFKGFTTRSGGRTGQSKTRTILILVTAAGAAYASNLAVKYAAQLGVFDQSISEKFQGQAKGDYGVLVGGRPETLVALQAIRDSPILGHGSYPVDPKYFQMKQDIQYEHGYSDSDEPDESVDPVIPTHSHLTMAWVESGILGGICWIYFFVLTFRAVLKLSSQRPTMAPLYSFLLVWFMWDILYSPFGSVNRLWAAFFILLSYHLLEPAGATNLAKLQRRPGSSPRKQMLRPRRRAS